MILDYDYSKDKKQFSISYIKPDGNKEILHFDNIQKFLTYYSTPEGRFMNWDGSRCDTKYTYKPSRFDIKEFIYNLDSDIQNKLDGKTFPKLYTFDIETRLKDGPHGEAGGEGLPVRDEQGEDLGAAGELERREPAAQPDCAGHGPRGGTAERGFLRAGGRVDQRAVQRPVPGGREGPDQEGPAGAAGPGGRDGKGEQPAGVLVLHVPGQDQPELSAAAGLPDSGKPGGYHRRIHHDD